MIEFAKGLLSAVGGAFVFGAILVIAYLYRRRYPRTRPIDVLDYDNAHPDGWMGHYNEDKQ